MQCKLHFGCTHLKASVINIVILTVGHLILYTVKRFWVLQPATKLLWFSLPALISCVHVQQAAVKKL